MSRSRAITGALTMLTESRIGASRPVSAAWVSGRQLSVGDLALVLDGDALEAGAGQLPGEGAELLGQRHVGLQGAASSAVSDGMLSALVTAPVSR